MRQYLYHPSVFWLPKKFRTKTRVGGPSWAILYSGLMSSALATNANVSDGAILTADSEQRPFYP